MRLSDGNFVLTWPFVKETPASCECVKCTNSDVVNVGGTYTEEGEQVETVLMCGECWHVWSVFEEVTS